MLTFRTSRRAIATAAATLALTGSAAIGVGSTARAATAQATPASCTIIDIGNPGSINIDTMYGGQVEQQYDSCGNVRAHFQYSYNFWSIHRGFGSYQGNRYSAHPCVQTLNYVPQACATGDTVDGPTQDVYTAWVPIHSANPDTWQAVVTSPTGCSEAGGSWHAYANGATWGDYSSCS
ncbi:MULTISPECIES: hypothetical protein [Streptomyces]|uniref:Secreted protein n=1 Tax=Streptomyces camelliae TaxID=3004093 RepID=A0ABY7PIV9_9ACTN|nr:MULTISPECIES: hypothetical protein [unclassified Streptomyces]WBO69692.1 hypothetical protein O1G22_43935 [Streptomyces sp. HUAS 2-6]